MTQNALATIDPNVLGGTGLAAWLESFKPNVYSNHRGAARPDYAVAGMIWAKSISSAAEEIYYYDGAGDILLGTFNPTDHTLLAKLLKSLDAGATFGPDLLLDRASPSPQANDILGAVRWGMRNASAAQVIAAMDTAEIVTTTAAAEAARRLFQVMIAGALSTRMTLGQGLFMAGATGDDPGPGKINAAGLQINGVDLSTSVGLQLSVTAKTATYSMLAADKGTEINFTTAGVTFNLLAAATAGNGATVAVRNSASSGDVTIDPNGAETLDGLATRLLRPGDIVLLRSDGAAWLTVSGAYSFVSGEQTLALSTMFAVSHGLGEKPNFVRAVFRCTTANMNWAVGDEIDYGAVQWSYGGALQADATTIRASVNQTYYPNITDKSSGSGGGLTGTAWKLVLIAKSIKG